MRTCRIGWAQSVRRRIGPPIRRGKVRSIRRAACRSACAGILQALIHGGKVGSASEALGYRVVHMAEFEDLGIEKSVELIRERVGDGPAYITFDLDCLDPSVAPGRFKS